VGGSLRVWVQAEWDPVEDLQLPVWAGAVEWVDFN